MRALGRDPTIEQLTGKNSVCEVHFLDEDKFVVKNRLKLRPNAIPRLHLRKSSLRAPTDQKTYRTTISDPNEAMPKPRILRTSAMPNSRNSLLENAESSIENIEPPPKSLNVSRTPSTNLTQTVRPLQKVRILPVPSQGASQTLVHLPLIPGDSRNAMTTPVIIIPRVPGATPNNIYIQQGAGIIPQSSISTAAAISGSHHLDMSNLSTDNGGGSSCSIQNVTHTNQPMPQTEFNCRTCLDLVSDLMERTPVSMICFGEKTVREGLVELLPEMKSTLDDDHFVCPKCFLLLRDTLRFLKRCLETERVITNGLKIESDDAFDEPEFVTVQDDEESTNPNSEDPLNSDDHNYLDECGTDDSISPDECDHCYEEDHSAFEFDPNVEEQDYILNGITNLLKGREETTTSNNPKESDLNNCVIKHLNFVPLEHAKVSDHDTIVSIKNLEPDFMLSLQQEKIGLLQNCSKFDENIFKNKRVLLLGGHTEIKCLLCEEIFNTEAKMQDHMLEVHGLSKAYLMEAHRYQYKPGSLNTCEACGKKCLSRASKKNHLNICHVFPCPYCDKLFNAAMLRTHTKEAHNDSRPFKCFRCKQETTNYTDYQSHSCSPLICETCGAEFVDKNSFRLHSIRCKKKEDERKKCPECRERFSLSEYSNHVKIHQYPCSICGKIFHSRKAVGKHEHYHFSQKNETLCPICGKLVNILSQHLAIHHENRMKNVKCSLCPKSYFQKNHLSRHMKLHHMFTRIVCERCGKYCNEHNIDTHYSSEHPNETEFKCAECEATFTRLAFLKQHAKSHADETRNRKRRYNNYNRKNKSMNKPSRPRDVESFVRKYKFRIKEPDTPITCKHCLKTMKGLACYRRHLETHLPLPRYKCRYCDISYTSWGNRRRHEKLHKDPKYKFRCGECWKIMENQDELDAHMAGHAAKPKKYQCGECSQLFCREYQLRSHVLNDHIKEDDLEQARDELLKDALMEFAV